MKTIILGLGNPAFGDDGVGALVARALKLELAGSGVAVEAAAVAGLDVLDILSGFERAIIIDAIQSPQGQPGSIYRMAESQLPAFQEKTPHQMDFLAALALGRSLGLELPREVTIFAIEAGDIARPNEGCTAEVERAIPRCLDMVVRELEAEVQASGS
jgi:hydrogenase maturation protease